VQPPRRSVLQSGVPRLDLVLGGGFSQGDLWLVIGPPGTGKTTLACQAAFQQASAGRRTVFISTLAEAAAHLVKHLRTFSFWNERAIGRSLFFEKALPIAAQGLDALVGTLVEAVQRHGASLLIIDGFSTLRALHAHSLELATFISDLAIAMAALGCTTLISSAGLAEHDAWSAPELSMCDGILELAQSQRGFDSRRSLRLWKMRGAEGLLGVHTIDISGDGLSVFPRFESLALPSEIPYEPTRVSTGVQPLDEMLGGGLPRGSSTILAGAPGTGKTFLALHYLLAGTQHGERGLLVSLRDTKAELTKKAAACSEDATAAIADGRLTMLRVLPVALEVDRLLAEVFDGLAETGATRIVFDSILELERSAPTDRIRNVLTALSEALRVRGVTALFLCEVARAAGDQLDFVGSSLEWMAENVVLLRSEDAAGARRRQVSILKMRDTAHDYAARTFELSNAGFCMQPQGVSVAAASSPRSAKKAAAESGEKARSSASEDDE
jgi:circadian clock protein KaiC